MRDREQPDAGQFYFLLHMQELHRDIARQLCRILGVPLHESRHVVRARIGYALRDEVPYLASRITQVLEPQIGRDDHYGVLGRVELVRRQLDVLLASAGQLRRKATRHHSRAGVGARTADKPLELLQRLLGRAGKRIGHSS